MNNHSQSFQRRAEMRRPMHNRLDGHLQVVQVTCGSPDGHLQVMQVTCGSLDGHLQVVQVTCGSLDGHLQVVQVTCGSLDGHLHLWAVTCGSLDGHLHVVRVTCGSLDGHLQVVQVACGSLDGYLHKCAVACGILDGYLHKCAVACGSLDGYLHKCAVVCGSLDGHLQVVQVACGSLDMSSASEATAGKTLFSEVSKRFSHYARIYPAKGRTDMLVPKGVLPRIAGMDDPKERLSGELHDAANTATSNTKQCDDYCLLPEKARCRIHFYTKIRIISPTCVVICSEKSPSAVIYSRKKYRHFTNKNMKKEK